MSTPAQVVEQGLQDGFQRAQQRKQELEDEKRKVTLKTLQEDAETPQDKVAAIDAVYHKDPGVLKQHVENLTRRLSGQDPQPVVPPQQAQQARLAPLAARGKTPDQQALTQQAASGEIATKQALSREQQQAQQKQQQVFGLIDQYVKDPEQNKALKEDFVRKQAGVAANFKNLPGAAGQPYKTPNGLWVRPVQNADGSITEQPMPAGYAGPQAKPAKPILTTINGRRVLVDPGTRKVVANLGASSEVRTTRRQVPITDADGHVHIETLTSVTVPGQGQVDVEDSDSPQSAAPKGPAPRKSAGRPSAASTQAGGDKVLPFSKATPQSNTAKKAVDTAENSYLDVQKAGANGTLDPVGSQGVVLSWLRGRVNRVTATEIEAVKNLGGIFDKFDGTVSSLDKGTMTPKQYHWFLRSAKDNYENAQTVASKYTSPGPKADGKKDESKDPLGVL